jgi:nitrogen fixation protein FixH
MKKKSKNWMASAVKHPGALRSSLHAKKNKDIPLDKLKAAARMPGKEGQRARLALVFRKSK